MAEQLVTHAGHPCDADRWCVDDLCNQQKLAEQAAARGDDPLAVRWTLEEIELQTGERVLSRQQVAQIGEVRRLRQATEEIADDKSPHDAFAPKEQP